MKRTPRPQGWRGFTPLLIGMLTLLSSGSHPAFGKPGAPNHPVAEYQVKAAFILKFASFVQWPCPECPMGSGPIQIAVLAGDPFGDLLPEEIPPDETNESAFQVTRLDRLEADLSRFRMIFLPRGFPDLIDPLLERVRDKPILTIGEGEAFTERGGMIAFTLENNRVRFMVNLRQAQKANLKISSQLLNLARTIIR